MFEKLLALLPYNPGLTHQMAFYSRRMREEATIRRTGLIFLVLAFMIQFFAVISPPQSSVADSSNDLVNGGISSRDDAVQACKDNTHHYGDVLEYYGIDCSDVAHAEVTNISSTGENKKLFSLGRLAYGKAGETPVNIKGASYFWRYLWSWDTAGPSNYKALKLHSHVTDKTFWILYNCGNLTTIGVPSEVTPPKPAPAPTPAPQPGPKPTPAPTSTPTPVVPPPQPVCVLDSSLLASDSRCQPCQFNNSILANSSECKPCDKSVSSADSTACITVSKTASNLTTGLENADGSTANPGDVITYSLFADNSGKSDVKEFVFQENLSDVLDYANVTDLHGGTISGDKIVSWPAETIKAGAKAEHQITVKVLDQIPNTPVSSSDSGHFDLVMTNVYGNSVNIKLPGGTIKTVEVTTTTLPNTGPGTTLLIAGLTVMVAGYFYARSELLAKESDLALKDMASASGV
jgi:uncharacterized repeat protein (TIGR01451 family)